VLYQIYILCSLKENSIIPNHIEFYYFTNRLTIMSVAIKPIFFRLQFKYKKNEIIHTHMLIQEKIISLQKCVFNIKMAIE